MKSKPVKHRVNTDLTRRTTKNKVLSASFHSIMSAPYYAKIFGIGTLLGAGMEVVLIQSNYYQMLAASEAKSRAKKLQEEMEAVERYRTMNQDVNKEK
jgi:hypothetical protein